MPLEPGETPEKCRARLLDTIGNLTLLTQELNSPVSNGPFDKKSVAIKDDSDLRLNAWLRNGPVVSWSEVDIESRGKRLFEAAQAVWGHPSPAHASSSPSPDDPVPGDANRFVWQDGDIEIIPAEKLQRLKQPDQISVAKSPQDRGDGEELFDTDPH